MKLCMVIPCYNEEEVLLETAARLSEKYDKLIFVFLTTPLLPR